MTAARIALVLAISAAAQAAPAALWHLAPGSRITVDGDSSLHKYHLDAGAIEATFTIGDAAASGDPGAALASRLRVGLLLRIPVAALHSGEGGLDKNARKALLADHFPAVAFRSTSIVATPAAGGAFALRVAGTLAIAGQTRAVAFDARAVPAGGGLRIAGAVPLRMSDFGIKPPRFMGMMKVADPVRVSFDLRVAR